jgi:hypothetical protein
MPRVGFESTIPAFERAKVGHAIDRAATVIGATKLLRHRIHWGRSSQLIITLVKPKDKYD